MQAQRSNTWPVANVANPISRSLRFRSSASAYLNRTPATTSNRKTWTWSSWIKKGTFDSRQGWFSAGPLTGRTDSNTLQFGWFTNNCFQLGVESAYVLQSTQLFRDPASWYHFVIAFDSTQSTATNRLKVYVNGSEITSWALDARSSLITQNGDFGVNLLSNPHYVGAIYSGLSQTDGYLTEINFIDGQALTPSSFGGTNAVTGVWETRQYTGTYGTNGFYLNFKDNTSTSTLGLDYSGNNNTWTTNNISLTAGSTYDSMLDVPTQWIGYNTGDVASVTRGNYATMNPVANFTGTLSNGNLTLVTTVPGNDKFTQATLKLPKTGKWYWENTITISTSADARNRQVISNAEPTGTSFGSIYAYINCQSTGINTTATLNSNMNTAMNAGGGGVLAFAYDADAGSLWLLKDGNINTGSTANVTNLSNASGELAYLITEGSGTTSGTNNLNFGQRPFSYTPPAGFLSLCTTNLPSSTILQGNQYFDATLYTGTGASQLITNSGSMQPDFVWTKARSSAESNRLYDSVRGATKTLVTNNTNAESTEAQSLTAFNSNGFTLGTGAPNTSSVTYVGWQWRATGSTVSNTAGSVTSTVSANTTAGFSIVTWTATNSTATIGHGLGVKPNIIIVRDRAGSGWEVYSSVLGATKYLQLNSTNAAVTASTRWNDTEPTSTVFTVTANLNYLTDPILAYCWAAVPGYSAFGGYTGNGSSTDGPFVFTGFRPRFIMFKGTSLVSSWLIYDTARSTINPVPANGGYLLPNSSGAEAGTGDSAAYVDILSNGFKIRNNSGFDNNSGSDTYIYMAFAENPFKNALAR
jgi:hypothetical protein